MNKKCHKCGGPMCILHNDMCNACWKNSLILNEKNIEYTDEEKDAIEKFVELLDMTEKFHKK